MSFGHSATHDLALCAGLGVAAACCLAAGLVAMRAIDSRPLSEGVKILLRVAIGLLGIGAIFAISSVIGDSKATRDPDSIWGFSAGVVAVVLLGLLIRRLK